MKLINVATFYLAKVQKIRICQKVSPLKKFGPVVRKLFLLQTDIFNNRFLAIHKHIKKFEVVGFETLSLTSTIELIKKSSINIVSCGEYQAAD